MTEISSKYNPKDVEDRIYNFWSEKNLFSAKANPHKKPFSIVIPPPNITGILHMGHALNNTIQDILIRYKRMQGFEALWMPGTDHAGIATQNVVERELAKEGKNRQEVGRDEFLKRLWSWREKYGNTIINQLKKLGCSCDWSRTRFTMDEEYSRAVRKVFVELWNKGLIYQDNKVINWCPRCQTALSDEEAPHRELQGNLYYLRYPFSAKGQSAFGGKGQSPSGTVPYIVVATTRPETMLGDTAVAVNPKDKRYKKFIGKTLILPLINREIKIISDSVVNMKFGTGAVKVTPAHDPDDYILGKKHGLEFVKIMYPNGQLNENAGDYKDMDRFEAREVIIEDLKEKGLLEKIEPHKLSAGHCYRCHTIIEPYLSKQWFVKMKPLAKPAIEAVKKGKIKFIPSRWTKVYLNWMENIQDWCISRQIWWGHRIPLWYCLDCKKEALASVEVPKLCRVCGSENLKQDEDVLDTWFSSWLWPFATFYWPIKNKDLEYFYPTSVLVTAPEIIFFWVARMIMAGLEFMHEIPFGDVYIHGTVRDETGTKMSKSLGNSVDPLEIIDEYGTDALRYSIIAITATGTDVFLSKEKFEIGRNFANKIWNASRLILMNLEKMPEADLCQIFQKENLALPERWILSRLYSTVDCVNKAFKSYRFNEAASNLYEFFWHQFCDWYLEIIKDRFRDRNTQIVCFKVLEKSLRMLHPFMPFITEEIWQKISLDKASIMVQSLPHLQKQMIDKRTEANMQILLDLITAIRNVRQDWNIDPYKTIDVVLKPGLKNSLELLKENESFIRNLSKIENLTIEKLIKRPKNSAFGVVEDIDFFVPLSNLIDIEKEKERIKVKINNQRLLMDGLTQNLRNKDFLKKAPKDVVEKERGNLLALKDKIKKLQNAIKELT
ncbi:MAG: valine--tRNA ligase [Candidatus Omnitrophota bacterium]|nr:valine--tRNA ligase [Candidatus Omnitrophota bacterium]